MAAVKALQQWCRLQCDGYRDVAVTNMTTSFRDGLAFCALIHRHRPDLIDYDSLRKENIYENNKLAFSVAEEKLGIPALLDAEDMVALKVPDRLSILTYVSQYYNYFHGRSPIGGIAAVKRPAEDRKDEPPGKKCEPVMAKPFPGKPAAENKTPPVVSVSTPSKVTPKPRETKPANQVLTESTNKPATLSSTCAVCKTHVHLVQRHLVDGKLYHRNCFKCKICSNILLSGTYKAGPQPGTFICTTHQNPLQGKETLTAAPQKTGPVTNRVASGWPLVNKDKSSPITPPSTANTKPSSPTPEPVNTWTPSTQKTQTARQKFFDSPANTPENSKRQEPTPAPAPTPTPRAVRPTAESTVTSKVSQNVEDQKEKAKLLITKKLTDGNSNNNNTLNSSGLKPADNRSSMRSDTPSWKKDQDSPGVSGLKTVESFPAESGTASKGSTLLKTTDVKSPGPRSAISADSKDADVSESPSDWRSKLKPVSKGPKPKDPQEPPSAGKTRVTLHPPKTLLSDTSTSTITPAKPESEKAPPAKPSRSESERLGSENGKGSSPTNTSKPEMKSPKAKPDYIPKEKILKELQEIEDNLNDLEKEGVELEKRLRLCEEEGQEDVVMNDLMVDWFSLIRNKQVYMRRESELVYIAKTQDLEEQQPGVEEELRRLLEKPEHLKTLADKKREEQLMEKLVEIVNDRNAIVEGLDEDRLREEEEDQQLNEMMKILDVKRSKNKKKSPIAKLFKWKNKDSVED